MLRLVVFWSFFIFLISALVVAQSTTSSTQSSIQSSSSSTFSLAFSSSSSSTSSSTSSSITPTSTIPTTPTTTLGQGPVGQPAPTTGTPGGPTPFSYTTVIGGLTQVENGTFTPTNPTTVPVTPTGTGTIQDFSSWLSIYGPTHTSSTGSGYSLSPIPFTLILIILLGILGGGGMLYV